MQAIAKALVQAQKEFGPALKTSTNPAFRSKYANLSSCIEAVIDGLNNNGIYLMQITHDCESGVTVETIFIHESGEQLSSGKLHVPVTKHDAQGYGSALTYARRYSLMTACGIAPEDDDGNAAAQAAPRAQVAQVAQKAPVVQKPVAPKPVAPPLHMEGFQEGELFLKISKDPGTDTLTWTTLVQDATKIALEFCKTEQDLLTLFGNNRNIFDKLKEISMEDYVSLTSEFKKRKDEILLKD
jgi:hypothetical protein